MIYKDNEQLIKEYKKLLIDNGLKQSDIAARLNQSRQAFNVGLKHGLNFEKLQRLLSVIGYDLYLQFVPKPGNGCTDQHNTEK